MSAVKAWDSVFSRRIILAINIIFFTTTNFSNCLNSCPHISDNRFNFVCYVNVVNYIDFVDDVKNVFCVNDEQKYVTFINIIVYNTSFVV